MKSRLIKFLVTLPMVWALSQSAHAITRSDVLKCGLPDGSKFVLRSEYDWNWIPLPAIHSSRVTNRKSWTPDFFNTAGRKSNVPASVTYRGKENPNELKEVCSHFGMLNGIPLAPFTFLFKSGNWTPSNGFPWEKLSLRVDKETDSTSGEVNLDRLTPSIRAMMDKAGIGGSAFRFGFIAPQNGLWVYEQPLYGKQWRRAGGSKSSYDVIFDAVYQSFATDNGKTWSDPIVTTDAKIFEIGKSWLQQSFIARPISLNDKPIPEE